MYLHVICLRTASGPKTRKRSKKIFYMLKKVVYRKNRRDKPDFTQF